MKVVAIVEGDGEVAAVPVLLRRIAAWRTPDMYVEFPSPIRVRRDRFLRREEEFHRFLQLASRKCGDDGWILILLDADDDCPAELGERIASRAQACISQRRVSVVLAKREFEAWFVASAESLDGHRGFKLDGAEQIDPEQPRDPKRWISTRMSNRGYGETTDQPAFCAILNLQQAFDRSRSFRKLCTEWERGITIKQDR